MKNKIDLFKELLFSSNENINLIGKSTINDIDNRHIKDSQQLMKFFTDDEIKNKKFVDLGSGAGFPGIILALNNIKNITLVEKSVQKCNFLQKVKKELSLNINIINEDIFQIKNIKFDIVVSRALANLTELLKMSLIFGHKNTKYFFLKGRKYLEEINDAKKYYNFNLEIFDSETSDEGKILYISKIEK